MVPGQPGQLVGAASVEHIAGVVPHTALGGHSLATRVGDLGGGGNHYSLAITVNTNIKYVTHLVAQPDL